jgi:hypothetical protein
MSERKTSPAPWVAFAALSVLVIGYFGAYYATVRQKRIVTEIWLVGVPDVELVEPEYPRSDLKPFFAPAHWLDVRIRRNAWEPKPLPLPVPARVTSVPPLGLEPKDDFEFFEPSEKPLKER